jgi:hypothetical protein
MRGTDRLSIPASDPLSPLREGVAAERKDSATGGTGGKFEVPSSPVVSLRHATGGGCRVLSRAHERRTRVEEG